MANPAILRAVLALALGLSVTTMSARQQPPAAPGNASPAGPQQPTFRTGVNFVRVDAIVTDKQGNPVADLKPTDFEVLEDGKPQTIESFRFVKTSGAARRSSTRRWPSRPCRASIRLSACWWTFRTPW